ncbi:ABC transporter substrate-binding protein [Croceivirga sp. JEA036]|uniref:ABC transporter substrate-binding protein n=1 Tax=Croceivirga sp. JEA036 TaxID=2721162 RepID=UPI00143AC462|nr:ABC transporter substrate-binding protein [Croceivirga sp. JEA036]NJB35805.1 amino acid ABC transporter substrate-binding protein [Croceivirga sp. JEA036]
MHKQNTPIYLGVIVPLTSPGWAEAGKQVLAGIELGVSEINSSGGISGKPIKLLVRDSAADPKKASKFVEELVGLGVKAILGEYHSVVAKHIAVKADELNVPFLCTSAVIDNLIDKPSTYIARLPLVQSKGWEVYSRFLMDEGHTNIAVAIAPSVYWESGVTILKKAFSQQNGSVIAFNIQDYTPLELCDVVAASNATALLLLTGYPEPAIAIVKALREDNRLQNLRIGAPAGQPEFNGWTNTLGTIGSSIPFLRYMPKEANSQMEYVLKEIRERGKEEPSFVALEGYDAIQLIAEIMNQFGTSREHIANAWTKVSMQGTRGAINLSQNAKEMFAQWKEAPVQVVERDKEDLSCFRVLF